MEQIRIERNVDVLRRIKRHGGKNADYTPHWSVPVLGNWHIDKVLDDRKCGENIGKREPSRRTTPPYSRASSLKRILRSTAHIKKEFYIRAEPSSLATIEYTTPAPSTRYAKHKRRGGTLTKHTAHTFLAGTT